MAMRIFVALLLTLACGSSAPPPYRGLGAACSSDSDCAVGKCGISTFYPGGYCWIPTCASAADCGANGECVGGGNALGGGCMLKCKDNSECRSGYHCCPDNNQVNVCVPAGTGL